MPFKDPQGPAAKRSNLNRQRRYRQTDGGKAAAVRYRTSDTGAVAARRHTLTQRASGYTRDWIKAKRAAEHAYLEKLFWPSADKRVLCGGVKRLVVLNDLQIPFEDPKAVNEALNVIGRVKPDGIVLAGDVVDNYRESAFLQDWRIAKDVTEEQHRRARAFMKELESIRKKWWAGGNHEERWWRIIKDMMVRNLSDRAAPVVANLLAYIKHQGPDYEIRLNDPIQSFARLFDMPKHGFTYYPYSHRLYFAERNLVVCHGKYVSRHAGYAAKRTYEWLGRSCIVGHTHRRGHYSLTSDGREHGAWENACLCQLEPEYDDSPNWQQGLCVVEIDGPTFHVVPVPIVRSSPKANPRAVLEGL